MVGKTPADYFGEDITAAGRSNSLVNNRSLTSCPTCGLGVPAGTSFCPNDSTPIRPLQSVGLVQNYQFIRLIGSGGMGDVYEAEHVVLKKRVAIKTLKPHLLETAAFARFQTEAQAASRLKHPNIVSVYDCGMSQQGEPFMVMDLVEGVTLAQYLTQKGTLGVDQSIEVFRQICEGISCAHEAGILHRDLKPSNIILENRGGKMLVRILDFGIAKILDTDDPKIQMTRTGELFGTPSYMSPEQCSGRNVDQRSDIYSAACILYEMLTGDPPVVGKSAMETMLKQVNQKPLPLSQAALKQFPAPIEKIVERALAKDPADRFATMKQILSVLQQFEDGGEEIYAAPLSNPAKSRRLHLPALLAIVSGTLLVAGVIFTIVFMDNAPTTYPVISSNRPHDSAPKAPAAVSSEAVAATTGNDSVDSKIFRMEFRRFFLDHARDTVIELPKLNAESLTDADLQILRNFSQLEKLTLEDCSQITVKGLENIAYLPKLKILSLMGADVGDEAIPLFAKMHLTDLNIARSRRISDKGLAVLTPAFTVSSLWLKDTPVGTEGLKTIGTLINLRKLSLDACENVTDGGVAALHKLRLTMLRLNRTKISGKSAQYLSNMSTLEQLFVRDTQMDGAGLHQLTKLKNLKLIDLQECSKISDEDIASFKKAMPDTKVLLHEKRR